MRQRSNGRLRSRPTAAIWRMPPLDRKRRVEEVCRLLEATYRNPRLGNPVDPLDDLIFLIISNRTQATTATRVYLALRSLRASWEEIASLSKSSISRTLKPAGFANIRSAQILGILKTLQKTYGFCSLEFLKGAKESECHSFLTNLPGVSDKVAKCVMIYTLGFNVLPVDAHVYRVSKRLGWTTRCRASESHSDLENLVPTFLRYGYHVNCVAHGRRICRSSTPHCHCCPLAKLCRHFKLTHGRTRSHSSN